jgi:hypothetical protein
MHPSASAAVVGYTCQKIAEIFKASTSNVKIRLYRERKFTTYSKVLLNSCNQYQSLGVYILLPVYFSPGPGLTGQFAGKTFGRYPSKY